MTPFVRLPQPLWEEEPADEELGWADDDSVPINIFGEVDDESAED
jgi:hypothetical protein